MENVHGIILLVFMPAVLVLVRVFGMKLMRYFNNKELEDLTEAKRITQPFFYLLAGVFVSISSVAFFAVFMIVPTVDNENRELPWILLMAFTFGLFFSSAYSSSFFGSTGAWKYKRTALLTAICSASRSAIRLMRSRKETSEQHSAISRERKRF